MPEYRWSRFVMCFYKIAQYDRKYKSNFNYYFLRECVGQQNTFLGLLVQLGQPSKDDCKQPDCYTKL